MAERRMFSIKIIDSDDFLDLPLEAQSLYFHLAMRADDDGFINSPKRIVRAIGASAEDLKMLEDRKFIIVFDSGIVAVRHWKVHNSIKKDRYKASIFFEEKKQLICDENGTYLMADQSIKDTESEWSQSGTRMEPEWIQNGSKVEPQVRIGKDSIDKDRLGKESKEKERIEKVSLGEGSINTSPTPSGENKNEDFYFNWACALADKAEDLAYNESHLPERFDKPEVEKSYNADKLSGITSNSANQSCGVTSDSTNKSSGMRFDTAYQSSGRESAKCAFNECDSLRAPASPSIDDCKNKQKKPLTSGEVAPNGVPRGELENFGGSRKVTEREKTNKASTYNEGISDDDSSAHKAQIPTTYRNENTNATGGYDGDASADWAVSPLQKVDNPDALKPVRGPYGRGIVCLTDGQLSDLKERLGENQLNRYMDKLASFIYDKGARIKSHYDTLLKWYEEDFAAGKRTEAQQPTSQYSSLEQPSSSQSTIQQTSSQNPTVQHHTPSPEKRRYGNFSTDEAFQAALKRSFGDDYDRFF